MARKPRIEFEGAFYHVITRGNQRRRIFRDDGDFERYLDIVADCRERYRFLLYAYVLMGNHVHLLIETREAGLSKILQCINQRYTQHFNRKYKTVGHVFQGRYKAILCDRDEYLLSLLKYIHHNPVRAGVVQAPEAYPWSSHRAYLARTSGTVTVDTDHVLRMFSEDKAGARRLYRAFMGQRDVVTRADVYRTIDQRILGDERFAEEVKERYNVQIVTTKRPREYTLHDIARGVEGTQGVKLAEMRARGKGDAVSAGRKLFSLLAKEYGYRGKEIAAYLHRDPSVITRYLRERETVEEHIARFIKRMGWR